MILNLLHPWPQAQDHRHQPRAVGAGSVGSLLGCHSWRAGRSGRVRWRCVIWFPWRGWVGPWGVGLQDRPVGPDRQAASDLAVRPTAKRQDRPDGNRPWSWSRG